MLKRLFLPLILLCSINAVHAYTYDVMDFYTDYKKIITELYKGIDAVIPEEERTACSATGASPVYGEILYESVALLIDALKFDDNDVFYDLGSGLGKLVTQVYLTSPVKKAWGIEFSENRFDRATDTTKNIPKIYTQSFKFENDMRKIFGKNELEKTKNKKFGFTNMDMLQADLSDATVVFTCSTCFGPEFMQKLTNKLAAIRDGLRIMTLVTLPYHKHVHYVTTYVLPMTWSTETPVYVYKVDYSKEAEKPAEEEAAQAPAKEEPVATAQAEPAQENDEQEESSSASETSDEK